MKKIFVALLICLICSNIVFAGLWLHEKNDMSDLRLIAEASAYDSLRSFEDYRDSGHENDYLQGTAALLSFQKAYHLLVEDTPAHTNVIICSDVYGYLLSTPEKGKAYIDKIIETLSILADDFENENGFAKMAELRNALAYEE